MQYITNQESAYHVEKDYGAAACDAQHPVWRCMHTDVLENLVVEMLKHYATRKK
jgi:hypothetical protein